MLRERGMTSRSFGCGLGLGSVRGRGKGVMGANKREMCYSDHYSLQINESSWR